MGPLNAGADLLLFPGLGRAEAAVGAVVRAVENGDLAMARLEEASSRVDELAESAAAVPCRQSAETSGG